MDPALKEERLKTSDGLELLLRRRSAENPQGGVIIVHGLCEHSGRYDQAASRLNEWGFSVFRFDLRGHGLSGGERGYVSDFRQYLEDTDLIVRMAREEMGRLPLFLLGHSMGGFIAAAYGITYPEGLKGVILSGAALIVLPMIAALGDFDYQAVAMNPIPNDLAAQVSRDPLVVQAYQEDPLVLKAFTTQLMGEVFMRGAKWLMEHTGEFRYPCLILHGGGDQIVPPEASRYFYEHISSADKTLKIYEDLYHEILNEPEREAVLEDIRIWLRERMGSVLA